MCGIICGTYPAVILRLLATSVSPIWIAHRGSVGPPGVYPYLYAIPTAIVSSIVTDMTKKDTLGRSAGRSAGTLWVYPGGPMPIVQSDLIFVKKKS